MNPVDFSKYIDIKTKNISADSIWELSKVLNTTLPNFKDYTLLSLDYIVEPESSYRSARFTAMLLLAKPKESPIKELK